MITYFREINEYTKTNIYIAAYYFIRFIRLICYFNSIYFLFHMANVFGTSGIFFYGKMI